MSPSSQTSADYEFRIRYLEEVVNLLLTRSRSIQPPFSSAATSRLVSTARPAWRCHSAVRGTQKTPTHVAAAGISFRYSTHRGLEPLVSAEVAELLATSWHQRQRSRRSSVHHLTCSGPSSLAGKPHPAYLPLTSAPASPSTTCNAPSLLVCTPSPLTANPTNTVASESPADQSSMTPEAPAKVTKDQRPDTSPQAKVTKSQPPKMRDPPPPAASTMPQSHPTPVRSKSLGHTVSLPPLVATGAPIHTALLKTTTSSHLTPPPSPPRYAEPITKALSNSLPGVIDHLTAASTTAVPTSSDATTSSTNSTAAPSIAFTPTNFTPEIPINHTNICSEETKTKPSLPTNISSPSPCVKFFSLEPSQTLTSPSMHTKPTQLCSISNPDVSSVDSSPSPSLISSQEQTALLKANIGSITVADDNDSLADHQLAPELSQTALEQYNDLDAYLDTLKADATKKRKKKNKQKT